MAVSENDLVIGPLVPAVGVTTISLDFYFEQASWLEVYKAGSETPLVLNTDYTVTGAGSSSGVVTLTTPANGTDAYSVYLVVPLERSSDMQLRGEFKSEPFNIEMDRIWQAIQGVNQKASTAARLGKTAGGGGPILPERETGSLLGWGEDGNLVNETTKAELASYLQGSELAALAAGAPIVTALADPEPADGTVVLLKLDAGLQVYEVVAGAWVLRGWLVGPRFDTVPLLLASTAATLGPDGQIVESGGFSEEVAPSGASDHDATTAGGVKLYAKPLPEFYTPEMLGADPTGATPNAAIINRLMTKAAVDSRKVLLQGSYLCEAQIVMPAGVGLYGTSRLKAKLVKGFNGDLLQFTSDVTLQDLILDGNKTLYTGGLAVQPIAQTTVRNFNFLRMDFANFEAFGIELKEPGQGLFDDARWLFGDGYGIIETGYYGSFPFIDMPRYIHYRACEVRSCKGAVHSIKGGRDNVYDIRIQQSTEHAYRIEGDHFMNRYFNAVGANDGAAFWVGASGELNRAQIFARLGGNLRNVDPADFNGGDPAEIYFDGTTGTNLISLISTTFGSVPAGRHSIRSRGRNVRTHLIQASLSRSVQGNVFVIDTDAQNSPSVNFDWSTVAGGVSIDYARGNSQPVALIDRNPGGAGGSHFFLSQRVRSLTANTTINAWDAYVRAGAGGGAFTVTLPDTTSELVKNKEIVITKVDTTANVVTVAGFSGGQTVNGSASITLTSPRETVVLRESLGVWERVDQPAQRTTTRSLNNVSGTLLPSDGIVRCITISASVTVTLPALAVAAGRRFTIYKQGAANTVTITPTDGQINGAADYTLSGAWESVTLACDGINWIVE